jgi:hypothetical protein
VLIRVLGIKFGIHGCGIDQDVKGAILFYSNINRLLDGSGVGDIQMHGQRVPVLAFKVLRHRLSAFVGDICHHHTGARFGKGMTELFTQESSSSRHQSDLMVKIE